VRTIQQPIELTAAPTHSQLDAEIQGSHHARRRRELVQMASLQA
jgi:hypothetical protein